VGAGVSAGLELVDRFCCLGDMLNVAVMLVQLWRPEFGLDGMDQTIGAIAWQQRCVIDGGRPVVWQFCAGWCVAWRWGLARGGSAVALLQAKVGVVGWVCVA